MGKVGLILAGLTALIPVGLRVMAYLERRAEERRLEREQQTRLKNWRESK